MLKIISTDNLYGISLQGDYQDLNSLYDSLSRYLRFYEANTPTFSYPEYEYMLSLNYDIRHAYMGDREIVQVGNSTYYSVNILYPLVFHYLFTLESILDDYLLPGENTELPEFASDYPVLRANQDWSQIRLFNTLLWNNLQEATDITTADMFYHYCSEKEYLLPAPSLYIDSLLHFQIKHFKNMANEERKAFLTAALFEIMGIDDLQDYPEEFSQETSAYQNSLQMLEKSGHTFLPQDLFFSKLEDIISDDQTLYQDTFDRFLSELYGVIPKGDENPDW